MTDRYDVAVIGAGVVGTAIARRIGRSRRSCVLIDARGDVGDVTSKANTAILHTGFDATPGSLEARLVRRGHALLRAYAAETGIPIERTGAVVVAWNDEQAEQLTGLEEKARANGYDRAELITADALYRLEPHLTAGALGALRVPDESIICPWSTTLAYATQALGDGVELRLQTEVRSVHWDGEHTLETSRGTVRARWMVNAAGLGGDGLNRQLGHAEFAITPRRGQLVVFDKLSRRLVSSIILPIPTGTTKGVLVAPTIYGNLLVGPTAEDLTDPADTATTATGLQGLLAAGAAVVVELAGEEITSTYAGIRAATQHRDYQVFADAAQHYVCAGGIRSTGLTASMALADHVAGLLEELGCSLEERADAVAAPRMPNLGEAFERPALSAAAISADPEYGRIVCFCERVSRGEVRDSLRSVVAPIDLAGVARRTRATNGRCQGFYCAAEVADMLRAQGAVS
ncbi:MAG: NAD(P)/FAD-dependent oxidoreductase [Actinomycetota bacterium]|nr:NAD(P)/FAD-dependent oxidoreductase [Actinomycetota bacterium]